MDQIHVREANSEVLVFIDKNMGDRLHALIEAAKIINREVIREQLNLDRGPSRKPNRDELSSGEKSDR